MHIDPTYMAVGTLFQYNPMYLVPKYQRAYAWDRESVNDFAGDLIECFDLRKTNLTPKNHFFGGILSVKRDVPGAANQNEFELIDGQQRITSFILLAFSLIVIYKEIIEDAEAVGDEGNVGIIKNRIDDLTKRFIQFQQEIQRVNKTRQVLIPSKRDQSFFTELINGLSPEVQRNSHIRLKEAYDIIYSKVKDKIDSNTNIPDKIDDLEKFQYILDEDFTILHMVTPNRRDAYKLFQVINDRGTNLTDGDLLRSRTLELLEGANSQQDAVELLWDDILQDHPRETKNYLNWIYESCQGGRAVPNALFDMFMDAFYPQHRMSALVANDYSDMHSRTKVIGEDIAFCKKLEEGQWLYDERAPILGWDISRLNLLIVELGHTLAIPLLLAAQKLDHRKFSKIVQLLEKVFFRYKLICKQHVTPLKKIYYEESLAIRSDPDNYNVESLKNKLRDLLNEKANDNIFKNSLKALEYKKTGGNKPLKYFLMTIEYYYQWYSSGASGEAQCTDKSRVYDFAGTSVEHIYPQNASGPVVDSSLETVKNSLGNLTIMDPAQNSIGGNQSFIQKKPLYMRSTVELTRNVADEMQWKLTEIASHQELLLNIALKVFNVV